MLALCLFGGMGLVLSHWFAYQVGVNRTLAWCQRVLDGEES